MEKDFEILQIELDAILKASKDNIVITVHAKILKSSLWLSGRLDPIAGLCVQSNDYCPVFRNSHAGIFPFDSDVHLDRDLYHYDCYCKYTWHNGSN